MQVKNIQKWSETHNKIQYLLVGGALGFDGAVQMGIVSPVIIVILMVKVILVVRIVIIILIIKNK